jgi:hypothetical protein
VYAPPPDGAGGIGQGWSGGCVGLPPAVTWSRRGRGRVGAGRWPHCRLLQGGQGELASEPGKVCVVAGVVQRVRNCSSTATHRAVYSRAWLTFCCDFASSPSPRWPAIGAQGSLGYAVLRIYR